MSEQELNEDGHPAYSQAQQFWSWFSENQERFATIHSKNMEEINALFDEVLPVLHQYCDGLSLEIGAKEVPYEIIITAEGIKQYFAAAEQLVGLMPAIPNWQATALKPAVGDHFDFKMGEIVVSCDKLQFVALQDEEDEDAVLIRILHQDYPAEDGALKNAITTGIYNVMDCLLGEKNATLDINSLEIAATAAEGDKVLPFKELPHYINWKKKERKIADVRRPEDSMTLYQGTADGEQVFLTANTAFNYYNFKEVYPILFRVEAGFSQLPGEADNKGILEPVYEIEDRLVEALHVADKGFHLLSETRGDKRTMCFYTNDEDFVRLLLQKEQVKSKEVQLTAEIVFDPYWVEVSNFIR
jgi:hypothetical protein